MARSIPYLAQRLAAAHSEDPATADGPARAHPAALVVATAAFVVLVVGLGTLMALGLDALVHLDVRPAGEGW